MAVNIGNFRGRYNAFAAESGHSGLRTFGGLSPAAESEEEAAVMMADASTDSAEIAQGQNEVISELAAADNADAAGEGFEVAASIQSENPETAATLVGQADIMAQDTASDLGVPVEELLPEIPAEDRQAGTIESGTGRLIPRKMYTFACSDRTILTRSAESLFTAGKALASSAWDKLIKLWRQFCQWVDKYVGTYPRLLKAVLAMRSNAKTVEGKRKEESKLDITSNIKMLAVPKTGGSAEPEYLTKAADLVRFAAAFGDQAKAMVDTQRSTEEKINTFAQTLGGLDFSTADEAKKSVDQIDIKDITQLELGGKPWHAYATIDGGKYKDRDGVIVREYAVLPGYQRVITFGYMVNDGTRSMSELISNFGIEFVNGDPDSKKEIKPNISFETMTQSQIEDVCDALKKPIEEIIAYRSGRSYLKGEASLKRLRDGVEKLKGRVTRAGEGDDASRESRDMGKAAVELANVMIKITALPMKIIERFKAYAEVCLTLCGKSINAYTAQK